MTRLLQIVLAILSGLMLGLSWPEITQHTWLIFFAFIPIYYLMDSIKVRNWRHLFLLSFIGFFIWHLIAVYWMIYSTVIGSITAWLVNSFLMAGIVCFSLFSASRLKKIPLEIIIAFYWLCFEIMHLFWSLSWPWMNLGNVFANQIEWIQWYEFIGVYGGSFWILVVNGILYRTLKALSTRQLWPSLTFSFFSLVLIFFPILLSHNLMKEDNTISSSEIELSVIQPNIDTYQEKFGAYSPLKQSQILIHQLDSEIEKNHIIILPETAIPLNFNINKRPYSESIQNLLNWSKENHKTIIGGFNTKDSLSYNSALLIEEGEIIQERHKIKLLPFGEKMPFDWIYKVFQDQIAKDGGNSSSYGTDQEARVFKLGKLSSTTTGVLICFESVFPDINAEMVRNGAESLIMITNDDWWNDSPGYRQHFAYARLRAIENRRFIARSANTGISGFIDDYGRIIKQSKYKEQVILSQKIKQNKILSLFSKNERIFRWFYLFGSFIIIIFTIFSLKNKPSA